MRCKIKIPYISKGDKDTCLYHKKSVLKVEQVDGLVGSKQRDEDEDWRKRRLTGTGAAPSTLEPHKWNVELCVYPTGKFRRRMMIVPSPAHCNVPPG